MRWLLLVALLSGCGGERAPPSTCIVGTRLGDRCELLCCDGLECLPSGFCGKRCRCSSGAVCASTSLVAGCPDYARCLVITDGGDGRCVNECSVRSCGAGEGRCAPAADGTPLCIGEGSPLFDGGVDR